jgi:hypothetical protein
VWRLTLDQLTNRQPIRLTSPKKNSSSTKQKRGKKVKKIIIRFALGLTAAGLLMASSTSAMQVAPNTDATTVDQLLTQMQKIAEKKRVDSVAQVTRETMLLTTQKLAGEKRTDSVAQVTKNTLLLTTKKLAEKKRADSVAQVTRETMLLSMQKN